MSKSYATVSDIKALGVTLTASQEESAELLIGYASAKLRLIAEKYGKDIDQMIADEVSGVDYALAVKNAVIQAVLRCINSLADSSPSATQTSQSALGYSVSMTYLNAGQSLYFLRNELKELGILRQKFGALEMYGNADD